MITKSFDGYIERHEAQYTLKQHRKANLVLQRQNAFCIEPDDEVNAVKEREAKRVTAKGKKTQKYGFFAYNRQKTIVNNKIGSKNSLCDSEGRVSPSKVSPKLGPAKTKQWGRKGSTVGRNSKPTSVGPKSKLSSFMSIPSMSDIPDKPAARGNNETNMRKADSPMKLEADE